MFSALLLISWRQWSRHKLRLALTILGVSIGVAVFFAIRTSNTTLVDSLHTTIEKLAGKATLQVTAGDSGFSRTYLDTLRRTPGVLLSEPVTETTVTTAANEQLLVLGLDTASDLKIYSDDVDQGGFVVKNPLAFTSRPDSIALSQKYADRYGIKDNDKILLRTQERVQEFTVRGFFKATGVADVFDGNVAVMDIYSAQDAFGKGNRIDRIDVVNAPDVTVAELRRRLTEQLPAGIRVDQPDLRGQGLENSVTSMNFGMTLMSFLALTICGFLIYNSFGISLNQRWREIGILRSIGVKSGGVQRLFLVEAAILGILGSGLGVLGGFFLAKAAIRTVMQISSTVYGYTASAKLPEFSYQFAIESLCVGAAASIIAAWLPSRAASRLDPVLALKNVETHQKEGSIGKIRISAGLGMIIAGLVLIRYSSPAVGSNVQLFYGFLVQVGAILMLPMFIRSGSYVIRPLLEMLFGAEGMIAAENMARSPRRTSSTVGAMMVGLAFVFSCGSLIVSQREALFAMVDKALAADYFVTSSEQLHSRTYHFTEATSQKITGLPDIAVADATRVTSIDYGGEEVTILAHNMDAYFAISPNLLDSGDTKIARAASARGEGVLISNNLGLRFGLAVGDRLRLDTPGGTIDLPVVGMLDYFRSEKGTIFLDRELYKRYWNDSDVDYIFIDLNPDANHAAFKNSVQAIISGERNGFLYSHEEYKSWVSRLIDQFFTLMYLQMLVAVIVAMLGLMNTMIISVDERRREIGVLRAIGGLRGQVVRIVLIEAAAIALLGLAAGAVSGAINAYFLVYTAAKVVAGFSIHLIFPFSMLVAALPIVVLAAILSALLPAFNAARANVVEAIGYE